MNSKDKGNVGEAVVLAEAIKHGYVVLQPFGDNARYDLVLDDGKTLLKVQIKAVTPVNGCLDVPCASLGYDKERGRGAKSHTYSSDDTDIIMCVSLADYSMYYIPINEVKSGSFKLRLDPTKNNQVAGVRWAKDYLWINENKTMRNRK